jgi:Ras-related protein Rab-21
MIWDTAGQERFHALGPIYYRDANGALLVYDITDRDSFTKVRHWVKELRNVVGKKIVLLIVGNKMDLEKQRQVNDEEAKEYAASVGAIHMTCSAKTNKGVEEAFLELTKGMLTPFEGGQSVKPGGQPGLPGKRVSVDISKDSGEPPSGCC